MEFVFTWIYEYYMVICGRIYVLKPKLKKEYKS